MARKPVAKVSPARGMSVDAWVKAKVTGWQIEVVKRVLKVAKAAAPKARFEIKWNQPVLLSNGPAMYIKPAKAHVTVGFWRGAQFDDPNLEGGDRMKHLKLTATQALDEAQLTRLVEHAVELNDELGDPSKR